MRRAVVTVVVAAAVVLGTAEAASAHPLGNFSVNHYDGLAVRAASVTDTAVIDRAEIPTAQLRGAIDSNRDGSIDAGEAAAFARRDCTALAAAEELSADGRRVPLAVTASSFVQRPGAAGLPTSRLQCMLRASVTVRRDTRLRFVDGYDGDRVGWHEVTMSAVGVHLRGASVPARTVSDELRHYPNDLLSSPLDVRTADATVVPGQGASTVAAVKSVPTAGPLSRVVGRLATTLGHLTGARHLTLGAALLAILVSLLVGAAHAALPGHGKTVMAAYLAGKRGSVRDAVVVAGTVTATHTAGVLALGIAVSLSSSLAPDHVTTRLGAVSGALVAAIGVGLVVGAVRRARSGATHHHHHDHPHGDGHPHHHDHDGERRPLRRSGLVAMGVAGGLVPSPSALVVLLGAIALGRTAFGVGLVVTYGVGMAATLTAIGLMLVRLTRRSSRLVPSTEAGARVLAMAPVATGIVVVAVGVALATRSLVGA